MIVATSNPSGRGCPVTTGLTAIDRELRSWKTGILTRAVSGSSLTGLTGSPSRSIAVERQVLVDAEARRLDDRRRAGGHDGPDDRVGPDTTTVVGVTVGVADVQAVGDRSGVDGHRDLARDELVELDA